jgi:hypothetical protein
MGERIELGRNDAADKLLNEKPAKRLQIDISPDLHQAFKMACQSKGTLMTPVLVEFMKGWLDKNAPVWMPKPPNGWDQGWIAPSKAKK